MSEDEVYTPQLLKYLRKYQENPNSTVFAPLAEAYRKSGLLEEALEICQEGLKKHPGYPLGLVALAHCYFDQKKFDQVIETLKPVIQETPENYIAQKLTADSYRMLGSSERALATYRVVSDLDPYNTEIQNTIEALKSELERLSSVRTGFESNPASAEDFEISSLSKLGILNGGLPGSLDDFSLERPKQDPRKPESGGVHLLKALLERVRARRMGSSGGLDR